MPRAIFSVYNKDQILDFAKALDSIGWDIVATGSTAETLRTAGLHVTPVEQLTGIPEMLGGRVKTLHPAIHGPILAREHSRDITELSQYGYTPIDLVVCNLYPFQQTVAQSDVTLAKAVEQIDIGGVTLIRAAAKNFERVTVLIDPADYENIQRYLLDGQSIPSVERRRLAVKAFAHVRDYDTAIYSYLAGDNLLADTSSELAPSYSLGVSLSQELRYGENPHQQAGLYAVNADIGPLGGNLIQGKPLSYNNLLDADTAWRVASSFNPTETAALAIIKHANPCGVAIATTLAEAFPAALASDPVSAFGGIIATNRPVDADFVRAMGNLFIEVLLAPDVTEEARQLLAEGRKNCRVLTGLSPANQSGVELRSILGGILIQQRDIGDPASIDWEVVTRRRPTPQELNALKFAWNVVQHVKSNAIVLAGQNSTLGIGGGLPSRVDAVQLAVQKAGEHAQGAVLASDAFFPFADGVKAAAQAGITAIIQPGGSIRDQEVIDAADAASLTMIFTKVRHFRH